MCSPSAQSPPSSSKHIDKYLSLKSLNLLGPDSLFLTCDGENSIHSVGFTGAFKTYLVLVYEGWPGCCVCTMYVFGAGGGQRRASDPLELELCGVARSHVGAGNQAWAH